MNKALEINAIDRGYQSINSNVSKSELVILCTPVGTFQTIINNLIPFIKKGAILTDVGSVKDIFNNDAVRRISKLCHIIPGHPIAGTEFSGSKNAKIDLFKNKWCILTPSKVSKDQVNKVKDLWELVGMKVSVMASDEHDRIMSVTSHLPHLIAFTIVGTAFKFDLKEKKKVVNFSAGGFRDFTRIASSDPEMWKDIFLHNRKNIIGTLDAFIEDLEKFKILIKKKKTMEIKTLIKKTKNIRKGVLNLKQN